MKIELGNLVFNMELRKYDAIIGVSSFFDDTKQCGFLDLDGFIESDATIYIQKLQKKYKLGPCLLLNCGRLNSHHAVFFDLKPLMDWIKICLLNNRLFAGWSVMRGEFILRVSRKGERRITFVKILIPENWNSGESGEYSLDHVRFFTKFLNLDGAQKNFLITMNNQISNGKGVRVHSYKTVSKKLW